MTDLATAILNASEPEPFSAKRVMFKRKVRVIELSQPPESLNDLEGEERVTLPAGTEGELCGELLGGMAVVKLFSDVFVVCPKHRASFL